MAKNIQFDPELVRLIKTIYGDAELNDRTLKQLYQTWKTNPDIIRNTAQQKVRKSYFDSQESPVAPSFQAPSFQAPKSLPTQEISSDDLRGVSNFNTAFKTARERGLQQFKWKNTKANPSGLFNTNLQKKVLRQPIIEFGDPVMMNPRVKYNNDETRSTVVQKIVDDNGEVIGEATQSYVKTPTTDMYGNPINVQQSWTPTYGATKYYQKGGTMNNQQEILKKAFINYLVQVTGARSEQDLAKLNQDQIKQLYQQFSTGVQDGSIEVTQDGQVNVKGRKAALGTKLNYFKKLQGKCPEGQQLVTFKVGGRVCKVCQKGDKIQQNTKSTKQQPTKKLDPEKTPVLPSGKYPSYWTADDRIKWERKYGQGDEGAAVAPPPVKKNKLGAALQLLLNKNR